MKLVDFLPYLVAIIGSALSYWSSKQNTEKTLRNEIETLNLKNENDLKTLMKQHEIDIENLKEKYRLEMEIIETKHKHELEKIDKEMELSATAGLFSKMGEQILDSPEVKQMIQQEMRKGIRGKTKG